MARGSLAPGPQWRTWHYSSFSSLTLWPCHPALHRSQNPGVLGQTGPEAALESLLRVWFTAPSIPASSPRREDGPGTRCPCTQLGHGGFRVSPWRGLPGQSGSHNDTHRAMLEAGDPAPSTCGAATGDSRCGHPPSN